MNRIGAGRARRIHPQKVATSRQMAETMQNLKSADHFRNLFEVPVLFYAAALTIYVAQLTATAYVALAWAFVVARLVHSSIQCTYNAVIHRLAAFATGLLLLWILWALVAWDLVVSGRG